MGAAKGCLPWNKGLRAAPKGRYVVRRVVGHPRASAPNHGVYEHVLVAEAALGHYLPEGAEIHHVDGSRTNNANRNLVICQDHRYHFGLHVRAKIRAAGGNPFTDALCGGCHRVLPRMSFTPCRGHLETRVSGRCRECTAAWQRNHKRKDTRTRASRRIRRITRLVLSLTAAGVAVSVEA